MMTEGELLVDKIELIERKAFKIRNDIVKTIIAVSYTHLDVYKRQA